MASNLKRVSPAVDTAVTAIAEREDRTFVSQLDRVVAAGLTALGEQVPPELTPKAATPTPTTARRKGTRTTRQPATVGATS